jgi:hypothetical protein
MQFIWQHDQIYVLLGSIHNCLFLYIQELVEQTCNGVNVFYTAICEFNTNR